MDGGWHNRSSVRRARRTERSLSRLRLAAILVVAVAIGGLTSLFAIRGARIVALRHHLQATAVSQREALLEQQALRDRLAQKDDLTAIEDAARERLGWLLPGEIRVVFEPPDTEEAGG